MTLTLINNDCFLEFPKIKEKSLDLVICDPPFLVTRNSWDQEFSLEDLWKGLLPLLKPHAPVLFHCIAPFSYSVFNLAPKEMKFRYEYIWCKSQSTGFLNAQKAPLRAHESILVFSQATPPYYPQKQVKENGERFPKKVTTRMTSTTNYGIHTKSTYVSDGTRYPNSLLYYDPEERGFHPTQKSVLMAEFLIKSYTKLGETVLDPTSGSGTTALACLHTGRDCLAIEKDPGYYKIMQERIHEEERKPPLFSHTFLDQEDLSLPQETFLGTLFPAEEDHGGSE